MIEILKARQGKNYFDGTEKEIIRQITLSMAINYKEENQKCKIIFSPFECFHEAKLREMIADYLSTFLALEERRIFYFCAFNDLSKKIVETMRRETVQKKKPHQKIMIITKEDMVSTKIEEYCGFQVNFKDVILVETSCEELEKAIALCKTRNMRIGRVVLLFGSISDRKNLETLSRAELFPYEVNIVFPLEKILSNFFEQKLKR